jgi:hypothetical protein
MLAIVLLLYGFYYYRDHKIFNNCIIGGTEVDFEGFFGDIFMSRWKKIYVFLNHKSKVLGKFHSCYPPTTPHANSQQNHPNIP